MNSIKKSSKSGGAILSPEIYWIFILISFGFAVARYFKNPSFSADVALYLLTPITSIIALLSIYNFKKSNEFKQFKITFLLGIPPIISLLITIGWSAIIFTSKEKIWLYKNYAAGYFVASLGVALACLIINKYKTKIIDAQSRVESLFKGIPPSPQKPPRFAKIFAAGLILIIFFAYVFSSERLNKSDIFLYILFINSIIGIPYFLCVLGISFSQLFPRSTSAPRDFIN